MGKITRILLIITALFVSVALTILLLIRLTPSPPVDAIENARVALSMAGKNGAATFSNRLFTEAENDYDSAMTTWQKENDRFLYLRDYEKVAMFARLSTKKSNQAAGNAISYSSNLKVKLIQQIDTLNNLIAGVNVLFNTYPLTSEIRERISKGKLLLKEAEIAFQEEQYMQSKLKISDAESLLMESYSYVNENLKEYFKSFSLWRTWIDKTINYSKKNKNYSIIIDKFSRKCFVYYSGIKKYEFDAELGQNWVGDKRVLGDMATPEGMYKIIKKIDSKNTRYYKALLLNYPNDEDKMKFKNEIINGSLPSNAKIGNMIEIHGNGGIGIDWTEGCIALTNREMDIIYNVSNIGTFVTIVGSMNETQNALFR